MYKVHIRISFPCTNVDVHKPLHQRFRPSMYTWCHYQITTDKNTHNKIVLHQQIAHGTRYQSKLHKQTRVHVTSFFYFYSHSQNPPMGFFYTNLMCHSDRFKFATVLYYIECVDIHTSPHTYKALLYIMMI